MRWVPSAFLVFALVVAGSGWNHAAQWATLFVVLAFLYARWVPSIFVVGDDGLTLRFPFGRRLFLPKETLRVRVDLVGAFALVGRAKRFGYPLLDHVLYVPGHDEELRRAFDERGYDIA